MVGIALDQHFLARGGTESASRLWRESSMVAAESRRMRERGAVRWGRGGVRVDLGLDQLPYRRLAVPDHAHHVAAAGGGQLAADHQQAVLGARQGTLDQDAAALFEGDGVGLLDFFPGLHVDEDAAAVVTIGGLDAHRQADVLGGFPGVFGTVDLAALGDRNAAGGEQALGQILVPGNGLGDGAGAVRFGRQMRRMAAP